MRLSESRRLLIRFACSMTFAATASAACAHAFLEKATPPVGGSVASSPAQIKIRFTEGVEPAFSTISLTTQAGARIPTGRPAVDPSNQAILSVKVEKRLPPGAYNVSWRVIAIDTHRTQGSFTFSVGQ